MNRTVFIMGAGASRDAGAPLMADFLDRAEDILKLSPKAIGDDERQFREVFDALAHVQAVYSKSRLDLQNIEAVFGAVEMGLLIKRFPGTDRDKIDALRESLITLIYKTLEESVLFDISEGTILAKEPYESFIGSLDRLSKAAYYDRAGGWCHFAFISFNYDICLDQALLRHDVPFGYWLDADSQDGAPLLKLHGSVNWGQTPEKAVVPIAVDRTVFAPAQNAVQCHCDVGSKLKRGLDYEGQTVQGPPVIVPPSWNKDSYGGQLSNVWQEAAEVLAEAENIFVIGYSLPETDSFFRYLFALGSMSKTRVRNFIVINPDNTGVTEARFRQLIGRGIESRFRYLPKSFAAGVEDVIEILGSLAKA